MSSDRIKVLGYAQKISFPDGIEYRNFSPDLVGLQLTSEGGTPLFTMGNFSVTTNTEPKKTKNFITKNFSNFVTLTDLDLTLESSLSLLTNNAGVILNLDKKNLTNYALFGSFVEFVRVSLEDIITNWPAALYVNPVFSLAPDYITQTGFTFENYTYDSVTNQASFRVNVNTITNNFQLNFLQNGSLANSFNQTNDLRNITLNFQSYSILYNGNEFDVLQFTGATNTTNDYLYFVVSGNAFSGGASSDFFIYYIKPNSVKENLFYNSLPDFEFYLLNRLVVPKFTATFNYTIRTDSGSILYISDSVTWPTTDGYNIDFDTDAYNDYASKLLNISTNFDSTTSNLMVRFLVTESITDFDTTDVHFDPLDQDDTDQKMNKTLVIYGAEYDEINKFISGIQFANVVTYDKNDNIPDIYLKNLAKVMGWELISSVLENDLLTNYIKPKPSSYSGQSVGLTAVEADVELWRRIILNTPWLWKSKGTRKGIEFLFKFIGTPLGLISFNEYVYLAENKIDVDLFQKALQLNLLNDDITLYPISLSGYPQPLPNTTTTYFQNNGLWYRETGGDNSSMDVNSGNNPHLGPYDGGYSYINQFRTLIPNFSSVTVSSETVTTNSTNLFSNYNRGTMTAYSGNTYVDVLTDDGVDFTNCYVVTPSIILDPKHRQDQTNCGCDIQENLRSLSVCVDRVSTSNALASACGDIASIGNPSVEKFYQFSYFQYNIDGTVYKVNGQPVLYTSPFVNKTCCNFSNSVPYFWNQLEFNVTTNEYELVNSGYICCQANNTCGCLVTCSWTLDPSRFIAYNGATYLIFVTETGQQRLTSQDGCNCIAGYTLPVQITDPLTGELGYGCQLTLQGGVDISSQNNSVIVNTYDERANGEIDCTAIANVVVPVPCNLALGTESIKTSGGLNNGSATVTPSGGQAPYTYLWNTVPAQSGQTAINLVAGTYMVTVTDALGCQASTGVTVADITCNLTVKTLTDSNNLTATATPLGGQAPFTYSWSNGQTTQTATGLVVNTVYMVTVTDNNGCQASATAQITPAEVTGQLLVYAKLDDVGTQNQQVVPSTSFSSKNGIDGPWVGVNTVGLNTVSYEYVGTIDNFVVGDSIYIAAQDESFNDIAFGVGFNSSNSGTFCGKQSPYRVIITSVTPFAVYINIHLQSGNTFQCFQTA